MGALVFFIRVLARLVVGTGRGKRGALAALCVAPRDSVVRGAFHCILFPQLLSVCIIPAIFTNITHTKSI